ncbi:MAG: PqqD family protein [Actinomycetota bacterium]
MNTSTDLVTASSASEPLSASGTGLVLDVANHILPVELDGFVTLYDTNQEQMYVLNGTASQIWLLMSSGFSSDDIVEILSAQYPAQSSTMSGHVLKAFGSLLDLGAVGERDDPSKSSNHASA